MLVVPGPVGRRNRCWDDDLVADLGLSCAAPPGYRRTTRGWVRSFSGDPVPGARDRTLRRTWPPSLDPDDPSVVLFDRELVRRVTEMAWVAECAVGHRQMLVGDQLITYFEVPSDLWERVADAPLGLDAPELTADQLVDVAGAARLLGMSESTVRSYKARGRLPAPQAVLSGAPLWTVPILLDWARTARRRAAS